MDTIAPFIAYSAALAVAAAIPGPGIAALVGRALGRRTSASIPFMFGLIVGDIFFLTLAVLGLSVVAKAFSGIFIAIKILGGLYLVYIAYGLWTMKSQAIGVDQDNSSARKPRVASGFLYGLFVTLDNPKTIIFYMALLPNVLDLSMVGFVDWVILSVLTMVVLLLTLFPYAFVASKAASLLSSTKALLRLNRGAATIISGAGFVILIDAIDSAYQEVTERYFSPKMQK
ncbi:MAG: LysE family translocator [Rhizobiaceae bacterium]|nr:LysE family translocator [Rhizobiaceae bacterium]